MPAKVLLLLCLLSLSYCATAPYIIAVYETMPFVIINGNSSLQGFSIDLWEAIARDQGIPFQYKILGSLTDLLNAVSPNTTIANASICSISITPARAAIMDFSQPMLDSGLQIMTYNSHSANANKTLLILQVLFSRLFWEILGVFFIFIIVFTHLFYLLERKPKGADAAVRGSYMRGGFEDSVWWSASILFTSGSDLMPMTALGRLLTFVGFLASCVLVAILQAAITAQLTVSSLQQANGISSVSDLVGLRVGVEAGSTAQTFLNTKGGITLVPFNTSQDLLDAFTARSDGLAAVFGDFPVFQYYVANEGSSFAELVGPVYDDQQYGIAFPLGSDLRRIVDIALLDLQEDNEYDDIVTRWFPSSDGSDGDINVLDPDDLTIEVTWGFVALSCLFVFILMSIRYAQGKKKQKQQPQQDMQLEHTDNWTAVEKEITELQEQLEDLGQRLHRVKALALRAKRKGLTTEGSQVSIMGH